MTLVEVLAVIVSIAVLFFIFVGGGGLFGGVSRRTANQMKNSSQLRAIHQGLVIYANSNNGHLAGLSSEGETMADGPDTGFSGDSTTPAARLWLLLSARHFTGELASCPAERKTIWKAGPVTTANFSYAMLSIADTASEHARRQEWKDNANSQAVIAGDRALRGRADALGGVADADLRSVWTTTNGDWRGTLVWGDNHAGYEQSHRGFQTRYFENTATGDSLFADGDGNPAGARELGTAPGGNAFMIYR